MVTVSRPAQGGMVFGHQKKDVSKATLTPHPVGGPSAQAEIITKALEDAPTAAPSKKEKKPGFASRAMATVRGFFLMALAIVGGGSVYDAAIGDGPMPRMNVLANTSPRLAGRIHENNTRRLAFGENVTAQQYWQGLQPTLEILDAVAPEIGDWVRDRYQNGKITFGMPANVPEGAIAGYQPMTRQLFLSDVFWLLPNGDKAATLAHEYRHARQNLPKSIAVRMTQMVTGKIFHYPSRIEDEAYLYQLEFYRAIGMSPADIRFYLDERDLYHIRD